MIIEITNRTLEPITTQINGVHYQIANGNVGKTVDVGATIPKNLLDMEQKGFIRIKRNTAQTPASVQSTSSSSIDIDTKAADSEEQ